MSREIEYCSASSLLNSDYRDGVKFQCGSFIAEIVSVEEDDKCWFVKYSRILKNGSFGKSGHFMRFKASNNFRWC